MKKTLKISIVSGVALVTAAAIAAPKVSTELKRFDHKYKKTKTHKNHVELLFIQSAKHASFKSLGPNTRCMRLDLTGLNNRIVFFADAPERDSGKLTTQEFLTTWKHNGRHYQPNVALEASYTFSGKTIEVSEVASLSKPFYNESKDTLSYLACPLAGRKLAAHTKLANVTVFFDAFHPFPP